MINGISLNTAKLESSLGNDRWQSAGQRFKSLLSRSASPTVMAQPSAPTTSFVICVAHGLHKGATVRLRGRARIGSASDNDIVLRDPGVRPYHAELAHLDSEWALFDVTDGREVRAIETAQRGHFERHRFGLGAAEIVLSQRSVPAPDPAPKLVFTFRQTLIAATVGLVIVLACAYAVQIVGGTEQGQASSTRSLAAEGFPDLELVTSEAGSPRIIGFVENKQAHARLKHWLDTQSGIFSQATLQVQVGSELAGRVRDTLADSDLAVDYHLGGVVRVLGRTSNSATRERLQRLSKDFAGVVRIDNRVTFSDAPMAPATPKEHLLPVRITDVIAGKQGSFSSGNGVRYFVGGILPDGAEVIAIRDDSVDFALDGKRITFFLNKP